MNPTNNTSKTCGTPTSSNCVIWTGPTLECINLCKGDTVSEVVAKLATELCTIMDTLKVSNYDVSCLTTRTPESFTALIQLIIDSICGDNPNYQPNTNSQQSLPVSQNRAISTTDTSQLVPIAKCFQYKNPLGDWVTTLSLADYAKLIGNTVCDILAQIEVLNSVVSDHETRIKELEDAPAPTLELPEITPICVLPAVPTSLEIVLAAVEEELCELESSTGNALKLYENIAKSPAGLTDSVSLADPSKTMGSLSGWTTVVSNLAQSIGNMWLTIADMRVAIRNIQLNCCPSGCDGISLTLIAIMEGTDVRIYVSGTIPAEFSQCSGSTLIHIKDSSGNAIQISYDLISYLNNPSGYLVLLSDTPINVALDLLVEMTPCLTNGTSTCQSCLEYVVMNNALCPTLTLGTSSNSITYSFTSNAGNYTYEVQVWNSTGDTLIANQIQAISGVQIVSGEITGLTYNTLYKVRVVISATACSECPAKECQFTNVTTYNLPCLPPTGVSAELTEDIIT